MSAIHGRYHWSNIETREKTIPSGAAVSGWVELREWADEVVPENADEVNVAVSTPGNGNEIRLYAEWVTP